jgi:hypothetical protein
MKKSIFAIVLSIVMIASSLVFIGNATAEEFKMIGTISKIEMAADGKSATAILKDTKSGEDVTIVVTDELTLDKFKDKRIVEGDEIRCRFEKEGGKNSSKLFRKTAGC